MPRRVPKSKKSVAKRGKNVDRSIAIVERKGTWGKRKHSVSLEGVNSKESPFYHIKDRRKRAFLTAYAQLGNKTAACQAAGIHKSTIYVESWRLDAAFQEAVEVARVMAIDVLEDEAHRRAVEGVEEPVGWYQGVAGGTVMKRSDNLLQFLLKGHHPERHHDRLAVNANLANVDLDRLSDEQLDRFVRGESLLSVLSGARTERIPEGEGVEIAEEVEETV